MAHDVYISYSSPDKAIADAMCATLERRGIRCWIAPRDIKPGESYASAIVDAVGVSHVFVLIFSHSASQSRQVVNEVAEAIDRDIPVIPFRIEDVLPSKELSYFIGNIHWLDALTPPLEQHLLRLIEDVQRLLDIPQPTRRYDPIRARLEQQLAELLEKYRAVTRLQVRELDEANRLRSQRELLEIEDEIMLIQRNLEDLAGQRVMPRESVKGVRTALSQLLTEHFDEAELRTLCFDMGLDYESLPAQGRAGKVREIVAQVERRGAITELIAQCRRQRPDVFWVEAFESASTAAITDIERYSRRLQPGSQGWYRRLPAVGKAAVIAGVFTGVAALFVLAGTLGVPSVQEWTRAIFARPTSSISPLTSPMPMITPALTLSPASSLTPSLTLMPAVTPSPTESTLGMLLPAEPRAAIALDSEGQVYVAWASQQSGGWDVYFARSDDGGRTFSAAIRPSANQAFRSQPTLAAGMGGVYLAWAEGMPDARNIYYTRIATNLSVSAPALVNDVTSGLDHAHPSVAVGPQGTLYVVWQDRRNDNWDIYGTRLQTGKASFEISRALANAPGDQVDPTVAVDPQGVLYAAWTDLASEPDGVFYACGSWPNVVTMQIAGGLLENLGNAQPALAVAPTGRAHLVCANAYIMHPIYGVPLYLPAHASTVGNACTTSDALPGSLQQVGSGYRYVSVRPPESAVAATESAVHVVLTTFSPRDGSYVWYYRAPAEGGDFGEPIILAHEENVDVLHYPAIAVGPNGVLHVVWAHQYGEQWRLHYTRSEDNGRTFLSEQRID